MKVGIFELVQIFGSLAFFIFGMKMMSEGIQRAAGNQMRSILATMTKNKYLGVLTGFIITALVQSSSATTVMTVSFVNAGLLSLVQSAGVMMGANIGTTITGWLISILGFKVNLSIYSIPLFAIGLPLLFTTRGKLKYWGEFVIGFSILFLGLSYLKSSVPDLKNGTEALSWLSDFSNWGIFSRIFFVLVGALVTIIVQSSSAAMAVTLTMCSQGWIPFEIAAAMILGENIGTTITAELASLVGNTNAKRSARIHSMFNLIGVSWMIFLLPVILPFLSNLVQSWLNIENPFTSAKDMPIALSAFHTFFNLTNVLLLLPFVNILVRLAERSVKSNLDSDDDIGIKFIKNSGLTPELAITELHRETAHFGEITSRQNKFFTKLLNEFAPKKQVKLIKKMKKFEEISDQLEIEITQYITKLGSNELTFETSVKLRSFVNICNDLERVGDMYYQIASIYEKKIEDGNYFLPEQRDGINQMIVLIDEAFAEMNINLNKLDYRNVSIVKALEIEDKINKKRDELKDHNLTRLGDADYDVRASMTYNNIFSLLEKVGDHISNVQESIVGMI